MIRFHQFNFKLIIFQSLSTFSHNITITKAQNLFIISRSRCNILTELLLLNSFTETYEIKFIYTVWHTYSIAIDQQEKLFFHFLHSRRPQCTFQRVWEFKSDWHVSAITKHWTFLVGINLVDQIRNSYHASYHKVYGENLILGLSRVDSLTTWLDGNNTERRLSERSKRLEMA